MKLYIAYLLHYLFLTASCWATCPTYRIGNYPTTMNDWIVIGDDSILTEPRIITESFTIKFRDTFVVLIETPLIVGTSKDYAHIGDVECIDYCNKFKRGSCFVVSELLYDLTDIDLYQEQSGKSIWDILKCDSVPCVIRYRK